MRVDGDHAHAGLMEQAVQLLRALRGDFSVTRAQSGVAGINGEYFSAVQIL